MAPYITLDGHNRIPEIQAASGETWEKLSQEDQAIIRSCARESALYERRLWKEREDESRKKLEAAGCQVLVLPERNGHVDLNALMDELGRREIDSVLLEGGGTLNWSALEQGVVQKVLTYIAPKLAGGKEAKTPVEGTGIGRMAQAIPLRNSTVTRIGDDLLIESEVDADVHGDR